jgi:hypothetical protein
MEGPLLGDIQQKTFRKRRWAATGPYSPPCDRRTHLRRHIKFGGRKQSTRQAGGHSDPAHAWPTYRIRDPVKL